MSKHSSHRKIYSMFEDRYAKKFTYLKFNTKKLGYNIFYNYT